MGTSVSQPSPRCGQGSANWKDFRDEVSFGTMDAGDAVAGVKSAMKGQYGDNYVDVVVDKGVSLIENLVVNFESAKGIPNPAKFMIDGRMLLSLEKANSFFAELALVRAAGCMDIVNSSERSLEFNRSYLAGIVDYAVSRDLTEVLGDVGISSISKLESYLTNVKKSLDKKVVSIKSLKDYLRD